jgi:tRNA 2-thiouridine synthesizing protein A
MDERPDSARLPAADEELDTSGLRCPEPLMLLRNRMRGLGAGTVLRVVSTDPASVRDFEQFCHFLGHEILHHSDAGGRHEFLMRKGARAGGAGR